MRQEARRLPTDAQRANRALPAAPLDRRAEELESSRAHTAAVASHAVAPISGMSLVATGALSRTTSSCKDP